LNRDEIHTKICSRNVKTEERWKTQNQFEIIKINRRKTGYVNASLNEVGRNWIIWWPCGHQWNTRFHREMGILFTVSSVYLVTIW